ncbi:MULTISPECIES: hypothetical protein [Shewanella]|uniref:Uncharacterized protein n=2 Tax=Shewanella TaxID=22 RepID=A0A974XI67_9GAMM|nr:MULTISPECIES: hypothetical protein [Shewanella]QSX28867.1 hypothetical protein JYB88_11360 [Shewanella cyperi]QSX35983.1 hypothetical protein JYB85_11545 [Shewanella sedimentimangrovi]QSX39603.1 hypothetical protein JYB84_11220 [Shewanella cyperi]
MASMLNASSYSGLNETAFELHRNANVSAIEKRKRLHWREATMSAREIVGSWLDERPELGDRITLYREGERYLLETWFNDGCHSLDDMLATETESGLKLEDKGGNFFGEYFIVVEAGLQFCNFKGCYYTAPVAPAVMVA